MSVSLSKCTPAVSEAMPTDWTPFNGYMSPNWDRYLKQHKRKKRQSAQSSSAAWSVSSHSTESSFSMKAYLRSFVNIPCTFFLICFVLVRQLQMGTATPGDLYRNGGMKTDRGKAQAFGQICPTETLPWDEINACCDDKVPRLWHSYKHPPRSTDFSVQLKSGLSKTLEPVQLTSGQQLNETLGPVQLTSGQQLNETLEPVQLTSGQQTSETLGPIASKWNKSRSVRLSTKQVSYVRQQRNNRHNKVLKLQKLTNAFIKLAQY